MKKKIFPFITGTALIAAGVFLTTINGCKTLKDIHPIAEVGVGCPKYEVYDDKPPVMITGATSKLLAETYQKSVLPVNGNPPKPDAVSAWISLDTLKKYIWHLEKQMCDCPRASLGLRIYYARYPDLDKLTQDANYDTYKADLLKESEYKGYHNIFFVPTTQKDDGIDYDFNPSYKCTVEQEFSNTQLPSYILLLKSRDHVSMIPPGTATGTAFFKQMKP